MRIKVSGTMYSILVLVIDQCFTLDDAQATTYMLGPGVVVTPIDTFAGKDVEMPTHSSLFLGYTVNS